MDTVDAPKNLCQSAFLSMADHVNQDAINITSSYIIAGNSVIKISL